MSMGGLIKSLRTERGLSQQELSKFSGVPFTTINKLENDKANVTIETLDKILAVFNYELTGKKKAATEAPRRNELHD
jgi:transcriptional regulator with XRE-family HTH domain